MHDARHATAGSSASAPARRTPGRHQDPRRPTAAAPGSTAGRPRVRVLVGVAATAALLAVTAAACGRGDDPATPATQTTPTTPAATTAAAVTAPLSILLTNDDGVGATGIDAVAQGLRALPGVTVTVVAPATNQSGTGGRTSPTTPAHHPATTASVLEATAVDGFPADAVAVATDVLHLRPNLVVSGLNQGQNLGPVVNLSGTVGAARAAAARGIPALAASFGVGDTYDYTPGVTLVVGWVTEHRAELATAGTASAPARDTVANLNVPNCATGVVRGERKLASEVTLASMSTALARQNCASTATPNDEIGAFNAGFATLTEIPATPAR